MKETARTISMKMSLYLADEVFAWLKEKGITSLDSIQQDILASRYHKVFFEPDEKMNHLLILIDFFMKTFHPTKFTILLS